MSTPVTSADFPEIRWHGHWIWIEPPAPPSGGLFGGDARAKRPEAHGFFRKTFTLADVPARVPARITADSRYRLYVNGQEVTRGPVRSQPRRLHYDLIDLAPYLHTGENVIAAYVRYYGAPRSFWMPAIPSITLGWTGMLVFEANLGANGWLISDGTWKAQKGTAWSEAEVFNDPVGGGIPVEYADASRLPFGWERLGFDESGWGNASVIPSMHIGGYAHSQPPTDPYGPMYPRTIAPLGGESVTPASTRMETLAQWAVDLATNGADQRVVDSLRATVTHSDQAAGYPLSFEVPAGGSVRLVMDFGRIVSGFVQFELAAPAGTTVDFSYVEDPIKLPVTGFGAHNGTRYVARGRDDCFKTFDSYGLRYVYVLVHGTAGPVTLTSFALKEHVYPWAEGAEFACSDEALTRLYHAGIRTVQLNSQDAFMDCPTREQRAWVGDSVVHQMVHLTTNLDWRLAWHYLVLGNSPRPDGILPMSIAGDIESGEGITIPDWSLHWVHGVYNLYRFTGDRKAVLALMPTVTRILRWYEPFLTAAGLLKDVTEWNLVDWASLSNEDTSGVITALWARGLREYIEMADWLNEKSSQAWAEDLYAHVAAGFEAFWDESRGAYVDHIKDGVRGPEMSQLPGAFAILAGLAPRERWTRIIETITDPHRLAVKSWTGAETGEYSPEKMMKQLHGIYEPDWDVANQVVIGQPFISYAVHDAVAAAGHADRLPELCRRWSQFLVNGYDTLGECWGWGTHVHGWSSTPTKDLIFYTLGVTPAEPGYTVARIAPRLGDLEWAEGKVPTPYGLISVRATRAEVFVDSPVPVIVDLPSQAPRSLPAGRHQFTLL